MSLVLTIGRWSLTLFSVDIDDPDPGDTTVVSLGAAHELAPGFVPPAPYYEEEE